MTISLAPTWHTSKDLPNSFGRRRSASARRWLSGLSKSEGMMPPAIFLKRLFPICVLTMFIGSGKARADYPTPPPPKDYDVEIRYQIFADRNQRITQFQDLVRFLDSIGFHKKPAADPRAEI